MSIIKKLIEFKNSETFIIVIKIAKLLWRLFRKEITDGNNKTGPNDFQNCR